MSAVVSGTVSDNMLARSTKASAGERSEDLP